MYRTCISYACNRSFAYSFILFHIVSFFIGSQDNNGHSVIVIHAVEQQNFTVFNLGKILCYLKEITR